LGLGADRVRFYNCSSAEGEKFAKIVEESVEAIRQMGESPFKAESAKKNDLHEKTNNAS
jgi:coenzyme F420-reducing hydrogenase delta subunit